MDNPFIYFKKVIISVTLFFKINYNNRKLCFMNLLKIEIVYFYAIIFSLCLYYINEVLMLLHHSYLDDTYYYSYYNKHLIYLLVNFYLFD